jgi:hypothetical protein
MFHSKSIVKKRISKKCTGRLQYLLHTRKLHVFIYYSYIMKKHLTLYNIARVVAAIILLQTLYYKFTAHPESVELFTTIGMEPWWRIWVWVAELVVWLLLLFGWRRVWLWALGAIGLMCGAVYFHIMYLGFDMLFWMAVVVLVCGLYILYKDKNIVQNIIKSFSK